MCTVFTATVSSVSSWCIKLSNQNNFLQEVEDEEGGAEGEDPEADDDEEDDDDALVENEIDLDRFDLDYVVNRPTSEPEGRLKCADIGDIGEEGELDCEDETTERAPWKKYKKYKTWKRRPLFVIIIGG